MPPAADSFDALVERADAGDTAAKNALFTSLYHELHRLAEAHIRRGGGQLTMSATTLLHEAYLDLNSRNTIVFPDRPRFLRYASRAMRGLIIDWIRSRHAQKRGGEITFTSLEDEHARASGHAAVIEKLGGALDELSAVDASLAELVDLKFFCGFSFKEIAAMRGESERTVCRDWAKARLLLHDAMEGE